MSSKVSKTVACPALVVAAPSSGSGKTTVVAALARHFTLQGKKVRVFKTGPDFIDPNFLSFASGHDVYQLDFWMCGEAHCKKLVAQAAQDADLILIEGVMGMFDGKCSSADIAATLGIPVLAVIDAGSMAQTFGAIAYGLANFRPDIKMHGVVANRVGSSTHAEMLKEALPEELAFCGYLPKRMQLSLPERHLGLVQAEEIEDLDDKLNLAAALIAENSDIPLPEPVSFVLEDEVEEEGMLAGTRIAIAKDTAFSFIYQANIDLLINLGADIEYFSPIKGDQLPQCDAVYLPGGYPELFIEALTANKILKQQLIDHVASDKPLLAECGGMLYLNKTLKNVNDEGAELCGILDAHSQMQSSLAALGLVEAEFATGRSLRGHTFHYSKTESTQSVLCTPVTQRGRKTDPVWQYKKLVASYIHWYFPSNPDLISQLFKGEIPIK